MVADGSFRRDLYFRLNAVPIHIPSLVERSEDIVPLALSFLDHFNKEFNTQKTLTQPVCQVLSQYNLPGNVRELENLIRRLVTMTKTDSIDLGHLPPLLARIEYTDHNPDLETSTHQDEIGAFEKKN